ncbi:hypothetical protein PV326_000581 [Microctonus aethiopoides]|nr:hypothetical protein PV326_000581 [Microctonus aethiopoides]
MNPCIPNYNNCLFNYGNRNNNQNLCETGIRMRNLYYSESDFTLSVSNASPILQRKAIRSPKGNIRKSRIRISEWAISSENPDCIIV